MMKFSILAPSKFTQPCSTLGILFCAQKKGDALLQPPLFFN